MLVKHKVLLTAASIAVVGTVGAGTVLAQSTGNGSHPSFVAELAQKLGLSQSTVQSAVDSIRQDNQSNRLEKLVQKGTITEAQKTAILNELSALQTKYPNHDKQSFSASKTSRQSMMAEFKSWLQSQGINLPMGFGMGAGHGMRKGFPNPSPSSSPSAT